MVSMLLRGGLTVDDGRFDQWTRALALGGVTPRRSVTRALAGGLLAAVLVRRWDSVAAGNRGKAQTSPAEPYRITDDCQSLPDNLEVCFEEHGVIKERETRSGDTVKHVFGAWCWTITDIATNEVVGEDCNQSNTVVRKTQDGGEQYDHANQKGVVWFTSNGTRYECTARYIVTFANGELRHEDQHFECNPPQPALT
jgi:hypothetical protein